ncbi:uncharacterized protein [Haliotis asinina]|uniref:uncharacterized protein n=1 Tax=Haliotis asinina TaxID=109174 RepID=UPI003531D847
MPMESDIDVLLSCYLADSDRSPQKRRKRKAVDPAAVVVEVAEGAVDTPTQSPAVRDADGLSDYVITCNFHDGVVIPAAGAHQPSLNDTADVCRIYHQGPEYITSSGRNRIKNITSPSRSNPLTCGGFSCMDYHAGQEVRPSRSSHGNRDVVPSISTHYGHVSYPDEISCFRTSLTESQAVDTSVIERQEHKKQKVMLGHVVDKSTYEYLPPKDVSGDCSVYYPTQGTLSRYVPQRGGLKSTSGFEHPLHSLSRCCEKMVPNRDSALKSLVDDMAAEVTGNSEKIYLEYLNDRWFGFRSEAGGETGHARHKQATSAWHQPLVTSPRDADIVDTLKVKANHIFKSVSGGTVTEHQQKDGPSDDEDSYGCEERDHSVYGDIDGAESFRGTYFVADSCGELCLEDEDEPVQGSGPSSDQVETGPEKHHGSHNAKHIRRILTRRRYILDTDSPSQTRSGFHPQTNKLGFRSSRRTNPPLLHHTTESTNPTSKLWHPSRKDHETINSIHSSDKDAKLPDKRFSSLQHDSEMCNSVHQAYELQSCGFLGEVEEPTTAVADSAPGSTLSDFRALVEAFDSEETVSENMVIDPIYGTYQETFTTATKPELSLHKPRPISQQLTYTCSLCGRDNLSRKTIRRHEARNYTCSKCSKKFCLQELLLKHKKFKLCGQEARTRVSDTACV